MPYHYKEDIFMKESRQETPNESVNGSTNETAGGGLTARIIIHEPKDSFHKIGRGIYLVDY